MKLCAERAFQLEEKKTIQLDFLKQKGLKEVDVFPNRKHMTASAGSALPAVHGLRGFSEDKSLSVNLGDNENDFFFW